MNPEDRLDRYIDTGHVPQDLTPADADIRKEMAMARMLLNVNTIPVPQALADRIDMQVRALTQQMHDNTQQTQYMPAIRFKQRHVQRVLLAIGSIAAALILTFMGISNAAADSVPGDPLYGFKQLQQQVALANAGSPQNTVNVAAAQLHTSVDDLALTINQHRASADILAGLQTVENDSRQLQSATQQLPPNDPAQSTSRDALQYQITAFTSFLQKNLPWPVRLAISKDLAQFGKPVVAIASAVVNKHDSSITIVITGAHVVAGTQATFNGQMMPQTDIQTTANTLVVTINQHTYPIGTVYIGVQNPDGSAAQLQQPITEHDDSATHVPGATGTPDTQENPDGHGTSVPKGTPEPVGTHEPTGTPESMGTPDSSVKPTPDSTAMPHQ